MTIFNGASPSGWLTLLIDQPLRSVREPAPVEILYISWWMASSCCQPAAHLTSINRPCLSQNKLSIAKDQEGRNALHSEPRRKIGMFFGIDFEHNRPTAPFSGGRGDFRRGHLAGGGHSFKFTGFVCTSNKAG